MPRHLDAVRYTDNLMPLYFAVLHFVMVVSMTVIRFNKPDNAQFGTKFV